MGLRTAFGLAAGAETFCEMLTLRNVKRVIIAVVGGTVLLLGVLMIVLPGPAFIVIPAGLAILSVEFAWAKRWLKKSQEYFQRFRPKPVSTPRPRAGAPEPAQSVQTAEAAPLRSFTP